MKILLDECIPRKFKSSLNVEGHTCSTVPEAGLAGKANGESLRLAEPNLDAFVTLDKGIESQQNISSRQIAVILIRSRSSRLSDLQKHAATCLEALRHIKPGDLVQIQ